MAFLGLVGGADLATLQLKLGQSHMRQGRFVGVGGEGSPKLIERAPFEIAPLIVHVPPSFGRPCPAISLGIVEAEA